MLEEIAKNWSVNERVDLFSPTEVELLPWSEIDLLRF